MGALTLRAGNFRNADFPHHLARDILGCFCPDIDGLVVLFAFGYQTFIVLALDLLHLVEGNLEYFRFPLRNGHVLDRNGNPRPRGIMISRVFQPVGQNDRRFNAGGPVTRSISWARAFLFITLLTAEKGTPSGRISERSTRPTVVLTNSSAINLPLTTSSPGLTKSSA